jgi:hypothetical protein
MSLGDCLLENRFKRGIIGWSLKEGQSAHSAIQNMVGKASGGDA